MNRSLAISLLLIPAVAGPVRAQFGGGTRGIVRTEDGVPVDLSRVRTAREVPSHSTGTPQWTNDLAFSRDAFTFVRIIYSRNISPMLSSSAGSWITDFPDSDLNLSFRLHQMTSITVNPDGRILHLTDPDLCDYPWIYIVEPGRLYLGDTEVSILRKYLLNGGFLMADDFWGQLQWKGFEDQIKKVFPDREFVELPMDHPVFRCVFDIKGPKNKLQIPEERLAIESQYTGVTWEFHDGEQCKEVHVRAIFDDKGRIMVIATHNMDNGDGWEREGESDYFFHHFSENIAFPLGINIIFYAMTH